MQLPKNYISYSALRAFLLTTTRRSWIQRYLYNEPFYASKEVTFGKRTSDALESDNLFDIDDDLFEIVSRVKSADTPEVQMVLQQSGYYIMGYLDACSEDYTKVTEYKTGKTPWTQDRVDSHLQLDTYSLMIYEAFGIIPECELIWMETVDAPVRGGIKFTGKVERFKRTCTESELDDIRNLYYYSAVEMAMIYKEHLNGVDFTNAKESRILIKAIQEKL